MSEILKDEICNECGKNPELQGPDNFDPHWQVICECGCEGNLSDTPEDAAFSWVQENNRIKKDK